jgi:hypothetical protein
MTMNELVEHTADVLGLSAPEAKARINRELNVRYKQVTSAIGMSPTRREEFSKAATIGSSFITFTGAEKLDVVYRIVDGKQKPLDELTDDEMRKAPVRDEPPTQFSLYSVAPSSVTVKIDCVPTTTFTLYASGLADASSLSSTDSPAFPESYHDILVLGVTADELRRKEKDRAADRAEAKFESRLSDLRMFFAKSAYLDIYRGKHAPAEGWWDTGPRR